MSMQAIYTYHFGEHRIEMIPREDGNYDLHRFINGDAQMSDYGVDAGLAMLEVEDFLYMRQVESYCSID